MAKTSGTTTGTMSSAGKASSVNIPTVTEKYLSATQSGAFKKLSRTSQVKMLDKVKKELQEPVGLPKNFTSKESDFLDTYASIKYQKINGELRSGKISTETQKTVKKLDAVFEKNVLKQDIIVYRGTNGSFSSKDKAYTSTSLDVTTANNFSRGNAKLHAYRIPKGTKAVYIGGGEKELLLPRDFDLNKYKIK